jgi:hypothetical protein
MSLDMPVVEFSDEVRSLANKLLPLTATVPCGLPTIAGGMGGRSSSGPTRTCQ